MSRMGVTVALALATAMGQAQSGTPDIHAHKSATELQTEIAQVDEIFTTEYSKFKVAGATVGVVSGPDLIWTKSYGLADIEKTTPSSKYSTYRIGSITKQITAAMLLQLVENGKVHLSDPVEKYYPEINRVRSDYTNAAPITLMQLASHTSGLDREPSDIDTYTTGVPGNWEKILLAALPHTRFTCETGTRYSYSNIGYAILGAALARAAREPYIQYVQEHILGPLGMSDTTFEPNDGILRTLARGYVISNGIPDPKGAENKLLNGRGYKIPNGGLFTTVPDLARFVSFEMGYGPETVLKRRAVLDNLSRTSFATGDLSFGIGLGFIVSKQPKVMAIGHNGSVTGYSASAYFNPQSHLGVICLRNADRGFQDDVVLAALAVLAQ